MACPQSDIYSTGLPGTLECQLSQLLWTLVNTSTEVLSQYPTIGDDKIGEPMSLFLVGVVEVHNV